MKWVGILLSILLLCVVVTVSAQDSIVTDAAAAYDKGDYEQAIRLYELVVTDNPYNTDLLYNLGTAYMMADDLGRALLNYRKAYQIMPRDNDLNEAIARLRAQRTDIQGDETELIDSFAAMTSGLLTITELIAIVFTGWILWFGLLLIYLTRRQKQWAIGIVVSGILLMFGVFMMMARVYVEENRPAAVIIADMAPIMSGPGEAYLEQYHLYSAAEIRILETQDEWYKFVLPNGRRGWVNQQDVEFVTPY